MYSRPSQSVIIAPSPETHTRAVAYADGWCSGWSRCA